MKAMIDYNELSPDQKLRSFWSAFCDADPVPLEFCDEMENAGLITLTPVDSDALDDVFAYERGIEPGGWMWSLTEAGRSAMSCR